MSAGSLAENACTCVPDFPGEESSVCAIHMPGFFFDYGQRYVVEASFPSFWIPLQDCSDWQQALFDAVEVYADISPELEVYKDFGMFMHSGREKMTVPEVASVLIWTSVDASLAA